MTVHLEEVEYCLRFVVIWRLSYDCAVKYVRTEEYPGRKRNVENSRFSEKKVAYFKFGGSHMGGLNDPQTSSSYWGNWQAKTVQKWSTDEMIRHEEVHSDTYIYLHTEY